MKKTIALLALAVFLLPQLTLAQDWQCSCVQGARRLGADIPLIDAKWFQLFPSQMPVVGGIVLLQYGDVWHVARISELLEEGVRIEEYNYRKCQYTTRIIKWDDEHLRGFWHN